MPISVTSDPTDLAVTLEDAKLHCRVTHDAENDAISAMIRTAADFCEDWEARRYLNHIHVEYFEEFPSGKGEINLYWSPLVSGSVTIQYVDTSGVTQTWAVAKYQVDSVSEPARIIPAYAVSYPSTREQLNAVSVQYTAGHGTSAASTPSRSKSAILLLVGHLYKHRETVLTGTISKEIEFSVMSLLGQRAIRRFAA